MSILRLETLLENQLTATGELDPNAPQTRLHFPSGHTVVVPTALLVSETHPSASEAELTSTPVSPSPVTTASPSAPVATAQDQQAATVIPLVEEHLEVSKRQVETARIRFERQTQEVMQEISIPLEQVRWETERVPVGRVITERPEVRREGDLIVFPVVEERLVVQRELYLQEEVHIRKITTTVQKTEQVLLKKDILVETRTELESA